MASTEGHRRMANLRTICSHECKPHPKPTCSTTVTRGFEAAAFPKIVRELRDPQLVVRQKALLAARELLGTATGHIQCIAAGITPAVIQLLQDADALVRERAAGTLEYVVSKEVGARDVVQHAGISLLVVGLTDAQPAVHAAAYQALIEASKFDVVRRELCQQRALVHLLKLALAPSASPDTLLKGLLVLSACVQARHNESALEQLTQDGDALPSLSGLLVPEQPVLVQEQAAKLVAALTSGPDSAKQVAVQVGTVPRLLGLLSSPAQHVVLHASAALMNISVCRDGKYAVGQHEAGLAQLAALLKLRQHHQLCINATEAITNVAEAPEARAVLQQLGVPALLQDISAAEDAPQILKDRAVQALRQCGFVHLPYAVLSGRSLPAGSD